MRTRDQFDLATSPLRAGYTLIEASAGTGKTYAIAGIVLRLVLEEDLPVEQILVTTYTELATAELRNRIRDLLRRAADLLERGDGNEGSFLDQILARCRSDARAKLRLNSALQNFDRAPIHTIHGFCHRILKDRAFESGALFDAELITNQTQILRELVDDFWRTHFHAGDPLLAAFAQKNGFSPEKFAEDLVEVINKPTMVVQPSAEQAGHRLQELWEELRSCWGEHGPAVREIFSDLSWAKDKHAKPEIIAEYLARLEECLSAPIVSAERLGCLTKFAASTLIKSTRVGRTTPQHRLFDLCNQLPLAEEQFAVGFKAQFFAWARAELKRRKVHRNVFFFDDLLSRLNDSLGGKGGALLAQSIRQLFPAALVDEFQDTDPVQYSIFRRIYAGSSARVFFIGDPKQAIYGFRGADVFTYLAAAQAATSQYTLGSNWRSATDLVSAVNAVFELRPDAFVLDGISFQPVEAAGKANEEALTINGAKEPALQLWLVDDEAPMGKGEANRRLAPAVAAEIGRLLSEEAKIGPRRVEPRDIAVLVSTHLEGGLVQQALAELQIPSVVYTAANVFFSDEAAELAEILAAVIEPGRERLVRAALSTTVLGLTSKELEALASDERAWESRLLQFQRYHELWQERGFIQMLRTVLFENEVRARLLSYGNGERRLTNLLHLAELLHRMCVESRLGMTGLLKRMRDEMRPNSSGYTEEYELRLERDERAVRIVTVHKSKGLQYGIVFCPFTWGEAKKESRVIFHEEGELVLDLAPDEEHERLHRREVLANYVRLLYVALTRAKHRCYLVWGHFKGSEASAPAHLFGEWQEKRATAIEGQPSVAARELPETPGQTYRPSSDDTGPLQPRLFQRALDRTYGMASFSRLVTGHDRTPESPDSDHISISDATPQNETALSGMFAFPRGTGPGTCLHHIFEEVDFCDLTNLPEIVRRKLRAFSLPGFDDTVCDMVRQTLSVPLEVDRPGFTLSAISKAARLPEMEFHFPVSGVTAAGLSKVMADPRLRFQPLSGFMKGYVDLIFEHEERFYIVDWKSNWLGPDLAAYSVAAMEAEMARNYYHLQLSIYTVALHRFLRAREAGYDYERHFGGAYYIFLRGVEPARPESGILRVRRSADFVAALDAAFKS